MVRSNPAWLNDGFCLQNLADAATDPEFVREMIDCYTSVFNAKGDGEWGESWTEVQARQKIFEETAAEAGLCRVVTWRSGGVLAGFSIVYVDDMDRALTLRDLPPAIRSEESLAGVKRNLVWLAGPSPSVCNFREVGIRKEFRKGPGPSMKLFAMAYAASLELGAYYACFWTSRGSRMYYIAAGLDGRIIYDFKDAQEHVMMGEEVRHALRRISEPQERIGSMLAERLEHQKIPNPFRTK